MWASFCELSNAGQIFGINQDYGMGWPCQSPFHGLLRTKLNRHQFNEIRLKTLQLLTQLFGPYIFCSSPPQPDEINHSWFCSYWSWTWNSENNFLLLSSQWILSCMGLNFKHQNKSNKVCKLLFSPLYWPQNEVYAHINSFIRLWVSCQRLSVISRK